MAFPALSAWAFLCLEYVRLLPDSLPSAVQVWNHVTGTAPNWSDLPSPSTFRFLQLPAGALSAVISYLGLIPCWMEHALASSSQKAENKHVWRRACLGTEWGRSDKAILHQLWTRGSTRCWVLEENSQILKELGSVLSLLAQRDIWDPVQARAFHPCEATHQLVGLSINPVQKVLQLLRA